MTSPCVLCVAHHRLQPKSASTFCVDVAVAVRAVVARRRCSRCRELGAGPCRAPSDAPLARPRHPSDLSLRVLHCPSPCRRPSARRPLRRRRRCRPRRRGASTLLALSQVRRRPVARAERARLSRAPVTTVTSPCVRCAARHRAAAPERADLPRRRRRCRPRRLGVSTLLALSRARRRLLPRAE